MNRVTLWRWFMRSIIGIVCLIAFIFLVVLPVGASFLITNGRFQYRERGPRTPAAVGLSVTDVEFQSSDGVPLRGWWNPGDSSMPVIIFVHGLNRSRVEMLERAAESNRRGYGVFLFDLRNHGPITSTDVVGSFDGGLECDSRSKIVSGIHRNRLRQFIFVIQGHGGPPFNLAVRSTPVSDIKPHCRDHLLSHGL
jgi:hypothetical protein